MKITAHFYSSDDAEFAAAALRRNMDGIFDISIKEKPTRAHRDGVFAPMGFFNSLGMGSTSSLPVPAYGGKDVVTADMGEAESKSAVVDVICRTSCAKRVSGILLNRGGHDLKGQ